LRLFVLAGAERHGDRFPVIGKSSHPFLPSKARLIPTQKPQNPRPPTEVGNFVGAHEDGVPCGRRLAFAMTFRAHGEGNQRTVSEVPARMTRMPLRIRQSAIQGTPYTAALEIEEYNAKLAQPRSVWTR
jgi:hypothetical protein